MSLRGPLARGVLLQTLLGLRVRYMRSGCYGNLHEAAQIVPTVEDLRVPYAKSAHHNFCFSPVPPTQLPFHCRQG